MDWAGGIIFVLFVAFLWVKRQKKKGKPYIPGTTIGLPGGRRDRNDLR